MKTFKVGFVGVGAISGIYLKNITNMFRNIEVYAVCDLVKEKCLKAKEEYEHIKIYDTMEELIADPAVDIVLNLTRPYEHYAVSKAALLAGKPVYSEKPLAETVAEGKELIAIAQEKGLFLGGAPDTFLGAGIQTCIKLIKDGYIGEPIAAKAAFVSHGHENWHVDPEFYYKAGGGPMMDMGPYYITALINLVGNIESVMSSATKTFEKRTITSQPHYGEVIDVDVPTHVTGILKFENGAVGTITTTFDVYHKTHAELEIYGTKGTLIVPDPNTFGAAIKLLRPEEGEYKEVPFCFPYKENSRAKGLSDMAQAIEDGADSFDCMYNQTLHVLEVMEKLALGGCHDIESRK